MRKFLILSLINSILLGGWRPSIKVREAGACGDPRIATNPYGIYIVGWTKHELIKCPDEYGVKSLDNGISWTFMNFGGGTPANDLQPDITADNQDVHVAWKFCRGKDVVVRNSYDNGENWGEIIEVSEVQLPYGEGPVINQSNGILYVFWVDERADNPEIYFKLSTDNGNTWFSYYPSPPDGAQRITFNPATTRFPKFVASSNSLYLVFCDDRNQPPGNFDIWFKSSFDFGQTWTEDKHITEEHYIEGKAICPSITIHNNIIFVVWEEKISENLSDIYFAYSSDNGLNWIYRKLISDASMPSLTSDENGLHLVYVKKMNNFKRIFYIFSSDNGNSWSTPFLLSPESTNYDYEDPYIKADEKGLHVAWIERKAQGLCPVFYRQYDLLPPSNPQNLRITHIAQNAIITLNFEWNPNPEPDLVGYNIYRRKEGTAEWVKLNSELITQTQYVDNVPYGTFYYYVTAVDLGENESGPSNIVRFSSTNLIEENISLLDIPPNNSQRISLFDNSLHILYSKDNSIFDAILKGDEIIKKFLGFGKNPSLFLYKGNLYTIWAYNDTTGFEEIRFSKYDTSWAETKSSYTTLNTYYWGIGSPSFYIENDTGYVVFESAKGYTYHILPRPPMIKLWPGKSLISYKFPLTNPLNYEILYEDFISEWVPPQPIETVKVPPPVFYEEVVPKLISPSGVFDKGISNIIWDGINKFLKIYKIGNDTVIKTIYPEYENVKDPYAYKENSIIRFIWVDYDSLNSSIYTCYTLKDKEISEIKKIYEGYKIKEPFVDRNYIVFVENDGFYDNLIFGELKTPFEKEILFSSTSIRSPQILYDENKNKFYITFYSGDTIYNLYKIEKIIQESPAHLVFDFGNIYKEPITIYREGYIP